MNKGCIPYKVLCQNYYKKVQAMPKKDEEFYKQQSLNGNK